MLAENPGFDNAASRRRRLRSISREFQLGAPSSSSASAGSFGVIVPSYNTADDAAQPDQQPQPSDATGDSTADVDHTHDISEGTLWVAVIVSIVAVVGVVAIACLYCFRQVAPESAKKFGDATGIRLEKNGYQRVQRFSNLRY